MRVIFGILVILILAALALLFWVYSGDYDVAADRPHTPLTGWLLDTAKRQSVRARAQGIEVPPLAEEGMIDAGAKLFHQSCEDCHGAPGVEPQPFAKHTMPPPGNLSEDVRRWTSAELFWLIRHGVRMTGMPAYGEMISGDDTWRLVALLQQLPTLQAERYRDLIAPPAPTPAASPAEGPQPAPPPAGEAPQPQAPTPQPAPAPGGG